MLDGQPVSGSLFALAAGRTARPLARRSTRRATPADEACRGPDELVLYELHVGTFTRGGDVRGRDPVPARSSRELGVTAIEIMPVAEFPGARGWGYDGVYI